MNENVGSGMEAHSERLVSSGSNLLLLGGKFKYE
jgi:hypothetical protein